MGWLTVIFTRCMDVYRMFRKMLKPELRNGKPSTDGCFQTLSLDSLRQVGMLNHISWLNHTFQPLLHVGIGT